MKEKEKDKASRRAFLGGAAATTGALLTQGCGSFNIVPSYVLGGPRHIPPSEKMNIGIIGCGGKGFSDMEGVASENIVALCDVDEVSAEKARKAFPNAKFYHDYREMLDKEKTLDAVTVSTPDHTHAPASIRAMRRGLHVYCQKPLTHTVWEAREMKRVAQKAGVCTQMGNQGTSEDGLRKAVEIIQSGAIGPVREVHVWTNRPIWPQGMEKPLPGLPIPATMKWDLWLGSAKNRDYNPNYAPFKWRGWWDFGTGALGDMACHTANMAFMALNLKYPTKVEAQTSGLNDQTYPHWSIIKFDFPARGEMPPLVFTWYDGGKRPSMDLFEGIDGLGLPEQKKKSGGLPTSGSLIVGDKGKLFSPNDYGAEFFLLPQASFKDYQAPAPTLPRSPGHYKEWIDGCKGGPRPMSNFDYAALLTETILLGNVAMRVGKPMDWDGEKMKSPNVPEANALVKTEYRKGFEI